MHFAKNRRKHTEQLHTANLSEDLLGEDLVLGNGRDVNFSLRHFDCCSVAGLQVIGGEVGREFGQDNVERVVVRRAESDGSSWEFFGGPAPGGQAPICRYKAPKDPVVPPVVRPVHRHAGCRKGGAKWLGLS